MAAAIRRVSRAPRFRRSQRSSSVAEVYDTLTAHDTYRTQMSSFEALTELRRVAGTQLDEQYVEVLAELLTGSGVDYRHANAVDFDAELNMERRIRQATAALTTVRPGASS